jgi:hypothetical protein
MLAIMNASNHEWILMDADRILIKADLRKVFHPVRNILRITEELAGIVQGVSVHLQVSIHYKLRSQDM